MEKTVKYKRNNNKKQTFACDTCKYYPCNITGMGSKDYKINNCGDYRREFAKEK